MVKLYKNETGFGAVEGILVLVIMVLIGVVGFMVYNNHHKKTTASSVATSTLTKPTTTPTNPTAGWTAHTSNDGKFSLKYPSSWVLPTDSSDCPNNQFRVGPTSSTASSCNPNETSSNAEVTVLDTEHICAALSSNSTTQQVTISGASGKEYTGSSDGSNGDVVAIGPSGDSYIEYCLASPSEPNLVYEATYVQAAGYPNVSSDFNLMVTKTLTFN